MAFHEDRTFYVWPDDSMAVPDTTPVTAQAEESETGFPVSDSGPAAPVDTPSLSEPTPLSPVATGSIPGPEPDSLYALPVMVVRPARADATSIPYHESRRKVTHTDIKKKAGAAEDICRYLGSLPSVVSSLGAGYDNTLFIRGGRPWETVFLVDGIEMENINHFSKANGSGGPIGFINNDKLASLEFYAGNMPVSFPARLSSAVDIKMKKGSLYERRQSLGAKLTGGMFSVEGPLKRGSSSYSASGRYVDFSALRSYVSDAGIPKAGDWFGKVFAIVNDNIDLSATTLLSWNRYRSWYPIVRTSDAAAFFSNEMHEAENILQGGAGATLRFIGDRISNETRLSASFRNGRDVDSLSGLSDTFFVNRYRLNPIRSERDNRARYALNSTTRFRISDRHAITAGARSGINSYTFRLRDESQFDGECIVCRENSPVTIITHKEPAVKEAAFYGIEPGAFLEYSLLYRPVTATIGFRADYFTLLDDAALSPRASLSVSPEGAGVVSLSVGRYSQFPTDMPSIIFDWLSPITAGDSITGIERRLLRQMEPRRLWQGSIGYDRYFFTRHEFRIETYYKWYDREYDLVTPDIQNSLFWNDRGELSVAAPEGRRRALGLETSLNGNGMKSFFYSIGGSLFDVKNRYQSGEWYNDWTDIGYTCAISFGLTVMNSHQFSFSLQGAGGRPFCPERIVKDCISRNVAVYDKGAPWFSRRLDRIVNASTRYAITKQIGACRTEAFLEVLNALDYTPTLEYKFNGERFIEIKPFNITPIAGCSINW
ncbi:MAG: TonB-dependent receptor plug domain-containing protein [Chitinispirillaceae bacterium]|nr:TonB-dependent receptor plug domain-containing protein [Chitinispirillaceae bacterium]